MTSTVDLIPSITSLQAEITSLTARIATETNTLRFVQESRSLVGAAATLAYVSAEQVLATVTDTSAQAEATSALVAAASTMSSVSLKDNVYGTTPSYGGNLAMAVIMAVFFIGHAGLGIFFRTWWFGTSYCIGTGLEVIGYIGRTLGSKDTFNTNDFLMQIVTLTIAPCFIMAGIYYLLSQLVMVYGPEFSALKPRRYQQVFITSDVLSLLLQAIGGGVGSHAVKLYKSSKTGTHIMVAGLAFQVLSMTIFLGFYLHFLYKIKFLSSGYTQLEATRFNPRYAHLRAQKMFHYFPIAILAGTLFVYIRSLYRVVELAQGWRGYLITHEIYFMCLDALMIGLATLTFLVFHPGFAIGKGKIPIEGSKSYEAMLAQDEVIMDQKTFLEEA